MLSIIPVAIVAMVVMVGMDMAATVAMVVEVVMVTEAMAAMVKGAMDIVDGTFEATENVYDSKYATEMGLLKLLK